MFTSQTTASMEKKPDSWSNPDPSKIRSRVTMAKLSC